MKAYTKIDYEAAQWAYFHRDDHAIPWEAKARMIVDSALGGVVDLTSPETIEKVAKELKRAALDNLGWSDQARAALRAVTEDTE